MKSIPALMRNAILVVVLISSFAMTLTAQATQATSSNARNNKSFTLRADERSHARNENTYPFEFHSGFWTNLHHFIYEQAILRKRAASSGQTTNSATNPNHQLSSEQRQLWDAALDYYMNTMIKRDLLFDGDMLIINEQLAAFEGARDLSKSGLSNDLIKILESVAPVYRVHWWPQHDKANRFWIAVVTPLVQQFSHTLINQLTAAFKAKWPTNLIRVNVAEYARWSGQQFSV